MSSFYIESSLGVLELTATTDLKINKPVSVTKHKVESGTTSTDNVVTQNTNITLSGIISDIKRITFSKPTKQQINNTLSSTSPTRNLQGDLEPQLDVKDYYTLLDSIRDSRELFTVHFDDRLDPLSECFFSNVSLDRNTENGSAYLVSVSIEQLRLSTRAKLVEIPQQADPDSTEGTTSGGNSTTEKVDPTSSLGLDIVSGIFGG